MTLWGGRFRAPTDEQMHRFNDSIGFDQRLYSADIQTSIAYAGALARAGLLTAEQRDQLVAGLEQVHAEAQRLGGFLTDGETVAKRCDDMVPLTERTMGSFLSPLRGC